MDLIALDLTALGDRVVPVLMFLACITVVADIADRAGLFDALAGIAVRWSGHRVRRVWPAMVVITVAAVIAAGASSRVNPAT